MKTLLEDYKRKLDTAKKMLSAMKDSDDEITRARLATKMGCYRTFIAELTRELNKFKV